MENDKNTPLPDTLFYKIITGSERFAGVSGSELGSSLINQTVLISQKGKTNEVLWDIWTESGSVCCILVNNVCSKIHLFARNAQISEQISMECDKSLRKKSLNQWANKQGNIIVTKYGVNSVFAYYEFEAR
jgi:hypothetical protein